MGASRGARAELLAASADPSQFRELLGGWFSELRRRWLLACTTAAVVLLPMAAYALLGVPTYTSSGIVQVSAHGAIDPLLELAGAPGPSEVETEVEIIRSRESVLRVLKTLRLHLVDPHQPSSVTTDPGVVLGGESPVHERLRIARDATERLEVSPNVHDHVSLAVSGLEGDRLVVAVRSPGTPREHEAAVGETIVDEVITLQFSRMPVAEGETLELLALGDGQLVETLAKRLQVTSVGDARTATNLVEVRFTDPDRETAQAVVQALMQQYLDQSLRWQSLSASNSAEFITQRLDEARDQLAGKEDTLREFAERERAVQLDTQAEVTIRSSAQLEAEKRKIELQEQVIGSVLAGLEGASSAHANLTSNFFEDPILAAAVGALTQAEIQYEVLRATLTDDHPRVESLGREIARHQAEVRRLLRSARRNLTQQRKALTDRLEESMDSLSAYPQKELQLARYVRDVEVDQRLYAFLLEKYQEAEILEASTTIDKRIVDAATLPHRRSSPHRVKLLVAGLLGAFGLVLIVVQLARVLQRRLYTVEGIKEAIPYPVYGSVPRIGAKLTKKDRKPGVERVAPSLVWNPPGSVADAFRALAANLRLGLAVTGRGRIIQITSCQPGEGKSTVAANVAIALAGSGGRVLLMDLDLRKPVQHRTWGLRRVPGFADVAAQSQDFEHVLARLQHVAEHGFDVLTAGTILPDPLSALMDANLQPMFSQLSQRYDYIIVDTPPIFTVDTTSIGRHADLVALVARPGVTDRAAVRYALESLMRLGANKALLLNGIGPEHAESYYYYYGNAYE